MITSKWKKYLRTITITSTILITSASLSLSPAQARPGFPGGPGPGPIPGIDTIIHVGALAYLFVDGLFYRHGPKGYIVASPPLGAMITTLPPAAVLVTIDGQSYYTCSGAFYKQAPEGYVVVSQPTKQVNPEIGIGQELLVAVDLLNVRSGPGLNYEPVGQLQKHEVIRVEAVSSNWVLVRLQDNSSGWVKTSYTSIIQSAAKG